MEIRDISQYLNTIAEDVCRRLLPNGKRNGKEWQVGNLQGDKGKSLTICLTGKKVGIWIDHATDESGGDLVDLWQAVEKLSLRDALDSISIIYNLDRTAFVHGNIKKEYAKPDLLPLKPDVSVTNYLLNVRKLAPETIKAYQVKSSNSMQLKTGQNCPASYYLPFMKDNELVGWKLIGIDRSTSRFMTQSPKVKPVAFGWQSIKFETRKLVITEGELDAMTWYQMGYQAISLPMGSGGGGKLDWIEHDYEELECFDEIYLSMDNDEAGQGTIKPLSERLGFHRCSVVTLPKKDANDCLMAGMGKEVFDKAIEEAKELSISTIQGIGDFVEDIKKELYGNSDGTLPGDPFFLRPYDIRFRESELTVWAGTNGHGKSLQLGQTMLDLAINHDIKLCIASMEMTPGKTFGRIVKQVCGLSLPSDGYLMAATEELIGKAFVWNKLGQIDVDEMLECFAYARKRYGCTHFVIDSLMKCGLAPDDYKAQRKFMDTLCTFKDKYKVHVHLVAHNRKSESENTIGGKMDIAGSGDITNAADNVITVTRNKSKEGKINTPAYDESEYDGITICSKQRNGDGWEGKIYTFFDNDSKQYSPQKMQHPIRYIPYSEAI